MQLVDTDGKPVPVRAARRERLSKVLPGGCLAGEVTSVGYEQAVALGAWLHKRYAQQYQLPLTVEAIKQGEVTIWASLHNRSLITLQVWAYTPTPTHPMPYTLHPRL